MHKKCFISVLIISISVSCSAWSEEEKSFPDPHPATTIVEDRVAVRDANEYKVTSKPLQIQVDELPDIDVKNQKQFRPIAGQIVEIKDIPGCCGQNNVSTRSEINVRKTPPDNERDKHPRFGSYPEEGRFSWPGSNRPQEYDDNNGRPGGYRRPYGGNEPSSERFQRPSLYNDDRTKSNLNFGGLEKFGGIGNKFGLSNKFGSLGEKFGIGNKFGSNYYGEGDYGRPGFPDGPELGNQEITPPPPANFATQQAVALKALAGVALIGAAAALATNPVLLPIGALAGRRKRNVDDSLNKELSNFPLTLLQNYASKIAGNTKGPEFSITPDCVARLTCEVHKDYITDLKKHEDILKGDKSTFHDLEHWFMTLIQKNILDANYVDGSMKKLIKFATLVGSEGRDCTVFICNNIKN